MQVFKDLKKFEDYHGLNLESFHIYEYTHIFVIDQARELQGLPYCLGFFESPAMANQVIEEQKLKGVHCQIEKVSILTDGQIGFRIGNPVEIIQEKIKVPVVT